MTSEEDLKIIREEITPKLDKLIKELELTPEELANISDEGKRLCRVSLEGRPANTDRR